MSARRVLPRLAAWVLAAVLLAAHALAAAHEVQHDLRAHTDASCVLHLHGKQVGHATYALKLPAPPAPDAPPAADLPVRADTESPLGYRSRAPPPASARSA